MKQVCGGNKFSSGYSKFHGHVRQLNGDIKDALDFSFLKLRGNIRASINIQEIKGEPVKMMTVTEKETTCNEIII